MLAMQDNNSKKRKADNLSVEENDDAIKDVIPINISSIMHKERGELIESRGNDISTKIFNEKSSILEKAKELGFQNVWLSNGEKNGIVFLVDYQIMSQSNTSMHTTSTLVAETQEKSKIIDDYKADTKVEAKKQFALFLAEKLETQSMINIISKRAAELISQKEVYKKWSVFAKTGLTYKNILKTAIEVGQFVNNSHDNTHTLPQDSEKQPKDPWSFRTTTNVLPRNLVETYLDTSRTKR